MSTTPVRKWTPLFLALLAAPAAGLQAQVVDSVAAVIHEQVRAIAEATDNDGRRDAIVARLGQIGLTSELVWFDPPAARANRRGANVVAHVGGTSPNVLLLGAHYDRVDRGNGVIDNAAGVAAVLHLAERFARNPLSNHSVRVALFDLEENGLLGSRAMVADSLRTPLPQTFLNFDVFGYGDTFWVGTTDTVATLAISIRSAAEGDGWRTAISAAYPPSDHLSFRRTSTKAYSLSIVDSADVYALLELMRGTEAASSEPPRIMRIIHTPDDTMDKLDAPAVARALAVVEDAIRRMDASVAGNR